MNRRSFQNLVLAAAYLSIFGLWVDSSYADPSNAKSEYLQTVNGGFHYDFDTRFFSFFLRVKPRKVPSATPLYLVASFENPQPNTALLFVKGALETGEKNVDLETGKVSGMKDRKKYLVTVRVYADKADTQLLGMHKQAIMFHYVPNIDSYDRRPMKPTHGKPSLLSNRPSIL